MKIVSLIAAVAALFWVGGETFAGDGLDSLKSDIQKRKEALERRKATIEKQIQELDKCETLTRIPEILEGFCTHNCPENLTQTSNYLSEFTSQFAGPQLYKRTPKTVNEEKNEAQNCSICKDTIAQDENSFPLGCGHCYHLECIQPSLQSYLKQEQSDKLISCKEKGCSYKILPTELAQLTTDSDQALAIQRMFVRSVNVLKFCPNCGEGIAKHNGLLEFGYYCQTCDRDLCFSCGRPPHHDVTCDELNTDEGVKKAFIREILKTGRAESYGLCPNCSALIEKRDGCDFMTCGQNASDKTQIPGSIQGRGCGHKFDWNRRMSLKSVASGGQPPASGNVASTPSQRIEVPVQTPAPTALFRLVAQLRQQRQEEQRQRALEVEAQRQRAGIIRVEADDPRVRDFPEFVALGEMFQVGNLILSGRAPQEMNYKKAKAFCRKLDGPRNFLRIRQPGGARTPTAAEWPTIAAIMQVERYNGVRRSYWSSSSLNQEEPGYATIYYTDGYTTGSRIDRNYSVRCVRSAAQ